jgi:hypothetical protein
MQASDKDFINNNFQSPLFGRSQPENIVTGEQANGTEECMPAKLKCSTRGGVEHFSLIIIYCYYVIYLYIKPFSSHAPHPSHA